MSEQITIGGAWSDDANAWVSEILCLTGDSWLEATLPNKGRLVIKKSETAEGPWPKALISKWGGPEFRIRIHGTTENRYFKIYLTEEPIRLEYANIQRRPTLGAQGTPD